MIYQAYKGSQFRDFRTYEEARAWCDRHSGWKITEMTKEEFFGQDYVLGDSELDFTQEEF